VQIYEQLDLVTYLEQTCGVSDFLVKISRSPENNWDSKGGVPACSTKCAGCSKTKTKKINPDTCSSKMLRTYFQSTGDGISSICSIHWMKSATMQSGNFSILQTSEFLKTERGCSLSDILEENVPQKYFLSREQTERILSKSSEEAKDKGSTDTGGVSCTLSSHGGGQGAKTGLYYIPATIGKGKGMDSCTITDLGKGTANCICSRDYKELRRSFNVVAVLTPDRVEKRQNGRRMKEPGEPMFTLTKQDRHGIYDGEGIRRLTPRETWRLQGVEEKIIDRVINEGISDTQMYIGAGDACTTTVIYEIAKKLT